MGDPGRIAFLEEIIQTSKRDNLMELNKQTGAHLLKGLEEACKNFPDLIHSARGLGTYCAFDAVDAKMRDRLAVQLRNNGIQCGGSGVQTIRLRPCLTFTPKHADVFLNILNKVLSTL